MIQSLFALPMGGFKVHNVWHTILLCGNPNVIIVYTTGPSGDIPGEINLNNENNTPDKVNFYTSSQNTFQHFLEYLLRTGYADIQSEINIMTQIQCTYINKNCNKFRARVAPGLLN